VPARPRADDIEVQRTRTAFAIELRRLEQRTLGGLDMVSSTLERALEALRHRDLELAHVVVADDDRIDGCYFAVNADLVTLLAT